MSTPDLKTLDITKLDDDAIAEELRRRIQKKQVSLFSLGFMPDLADIDTEDLVAEVNLRIADGGIDPDNLHVPSETGGGTSDAEVEAGFVDADCLGEAAVRFARRDYPETLWNLEKALGPKFSGLSDLVLGRH